MNYSELLQLAKSWGNFISDRIIIWRLHNIYNVRTTHTTDKDLFFWRVSQAYHKPILSKKLEMGFFYVR